MATRAYPRTSDLVAQNLRRRKVNLGETAFAAMLLILLLASLFILIVLLAHIITGAIPVFRERGFDFITSGVSSNAANAGVWQSIQGSIMLTVVVTLITFPIGIGAAIYLEEYAPDNRFTRVINTNIRNLAGVPSIVFGLLGLAIFVKVIDALDGARFNGRSVLAGGLTLAVLVLPITIITASEALRAVPQSIREAGLGVGATRWETIRHHVLPSAAPGILTGTVLTLARAFGETAPLLLVGAATGFFSLPGTIDRLLGAYSALPVTVLAWSRQPGEFVDELAPAAIVVLLVVLFTANAAAIILRNRYERKW